MGFKPRKSAREHNVADGDTLESIATQAGVTVTELARFNWGTADTDAINRALFEVVGCRAMDGAGLYHAFSGQDATRGSGTVLVPEAWTKDGLAVDKQHNIVLRKVLPMPAVSIQKLDKWFVPGAVADGGEACTIEYGLEGIARRASKVTLEVHASNYASAAVDSKGRVTFTKVGGSEPIYSAELAADKARAGASHAVDDYRGKSTAASGALKPRGAADRFINVAYSPYTVLLRYYKADADKLARLLLEDFWPTWDDAGALEQASCKVKWKLEGGGKLKHGQIVIWDRSDTPVFRDALDAGKIAAGEYTWDGKTSAGATINAAGRPYRAQVQAHSDMDTDDGLALAAAHTEVRLFVHQDTGTLPDTPHMETNSLHLSVAPLVPEAKQEGGAWVTKEPTAGEEIKWYQYNLAALGYHPGPVDGDHGTMTSRALREFQRAYPKTAAAPFTRLYPNGNRNADTKAALQRARLRQDAVGRPWRAWLGDPKTAGDPTKEPDLNQARAEALLNNSQVTLDSDGAVVWIEDRHYYTDSGAKRLYMRHYHGDFDIGDRKVDRDEESISRPWIPLQAELPLLKRDSGNAGLAATNSDSSQATRQATGPLRVDWTFEEIGEELGLIDTTHANYNTQVIRSRKYIEQTVDARKGSHGGKDLTNCEQALGGIRPTNLATYYKVPIGSGSSRLSPWWVLDDSAKELLCVLAHDDQGQAADRVYPLHLGRAGVFLHLSRVAGDGYRFRAAVSFEDLPGGASQFPNAAALKRRYPLLPRAHTTRLRQWRKTSYKGYLGWCPPGEKNWPGHSDAAAKLYQACHLHLAHEGITPMTRNEFQLGGASPLMTGADYRATVNREVQGYFRDAAHVAGASMAPEYVWPYLSMSSYGIRPSNNGTDFGSYYDDVLDGVFDNSWRSYREPLLLQVLEQAERNQGLLKGHLVTQFRASPPVDINEYECTNCGQFRVEITNNLVGGTLLGQPCVGCTGTYGLAWSGNYDDSIPLPAVGCGMGATWCFTGSADTWAHEMGHHKHLEHAQANPGDSDVAPGAKNAQHDAQLNNAYHAIAGMTPDDPANPNKDTCWDRHCIMSYAHGPAYFCGKCILKIRGWRVEGLTNPGGNIHD